MGCTDMSADDMTASEWQYRLTAAMHLIIVRAAGINGITVTTSVLCRRIGWLGTWAGCTLGIGLVGTGANMGASSA
jgi:hypothetical protein